ncbi:uncharacterized protein LOC121757073 [Salvia splendens]|uniref:uncharacterized protein LOC121757073 n=1 Tax=Salvia splendens TaxID=180675 RepID=UPI001C25687E|nr:uncharacterized protein LOC121757073 [Salvia splendens]
MEPLTTPDPDQFSKVLGLNFIGSIPTGKIWLFVEEGSTFDIECDSEQLLHGRLLSHRFASHLAISAIYAKCTRAERYPLWDTMRELAGSLDGTPWIIGGDFNTILSHRDRIRSDTNRQTEMVDFAETIDVCRLLDPGFDGAEFTWAKNGIFERLDRVLVREAWTRIFKATRVTNLPRITSDHGPILVRCKTPNNTNGGKAFRVKRDLKRWNKEAFGNIHANLKAKKEDIATAQANFEARPTLENRVAINKHIAKHILLLRMEEDFWRQKDNGQEITDEADIAKSAVDFFQQLLAPPIVVLEEPDLSLIEQVYSLEQAADIAKVPDADEVNDAAFSISGDSAPGPDGFSASFYQACWGIVGPEVVEAIGQFFRGAFLP